MGKDVIKAQFRAAHGAQLQKVANAQFNQMEAAAALAAERVALREIEKKFKEDMAAPETGEQLSLSLGDGRKK